MRQQLLLITFSALLISQVCLAEPALLPYSTRTKPFSGFATTIRGDIRTVGMAGATVGLADTFIAAISNPAGLAMTLDNADSNYTENFAYDDRIQSLDSALSTASFGAALAPYPWAFALGYISSYRENDKYLLPSAGGNLASLDVITRELHLSAARVFWKNRISLGLSLALSQANSAVEVNGAPELDSSHHDYAIGATLGASFRLPERFLLGLSYTFPMTYNFSPSDDLSPALPGFSQPVHVPRRYAAGLGWIPNRFFRADFTMEWVDKTPGAALIRDESIEVGNRVVIQPRFGLAYVFADYKDFKATAFAGAYFEHSRIDNVGSRFHKTAGIEMKPWVFTVGWGIDRAPGYSNYLVSLGVDIFKVMQKTDLIPVPWSPGYGGLAPRPLQLSDEGLARPLQRNWQQRGPDLNPIRVGLDIPRKLEQKVIQTSESIERVGKDVFRAVKKRQKQEDDVPLEKSGPPSDLAPLRKK